MADIAFHHGTRVFESQETPILIRTTQSAVIALIGTAPDADPIVFPLNRPVLIKGSTELSKAKKLGAAGTLKKAVDAVFDQVGTFMYVVRVAQGTTTAQTWSNLVGDAAAMTGVHALRKCEGLYGRHVKPRLVAVPGFTSVLTTDGIASIAVTAPGRDYDPDSPPAVTITGDGTGGAARALVSPDGTLEAIIVTKPGWGFEEATVAIAQTPPVVTRVAAAGNDGDGVMTLANPAYSGTVKAGDYVVACTAAAANGGTFSVTDPDGVVLATAGVGVAYTGPVKFTIADGAADFAVGDTFTVSVAITGGFGATATAAIGTNANPVVAELAGLLEKLRAVAFVDGPDTTDEAAVLYRQTINSDRIYVCDPKVLVWDTDLDAYVPSPSSPRFAGVQAKVDRTNGFWWSLSNKPINGIGGTVRPVAYGDQANYLNEAHVNTVINLGGEGFVTWGNRVATGIDLNKFISVRRTMDFINEAIEAANLEFVDKPFSKANLKFILESNNAFMRVLKAEGAILGGRVWLDAERNTDEEMAQGRVTFGVEFEPPAPMEDIRFIAHRQIRYYAVLRREVLDEIADGALALAS